MTMTLDFAGRPRHLGCRKSSNPFDQFEVAVPAVSHQRI